MMNLPIVKTKVITDSVFAYDMGEDLDIKERAKEVFDGIAVHDITFRGAMGTRIAAYLVNPVVGEALPGVIMVHPLPGNRRSLLDESIKLADRNVCSILIDAPWSGGINWAKKMGDPVDDRSEFIGTVKDLRRTIDVLLSHSMVNQDLLGYVGLSLGALCGGVLSGVDHRVRAYVLMSGTTSFSDVAAVKIPDMMGRRLAEYHMAVSDIDPINFVSQASPARLLIQIGSAEELFYRRKMLALAEAASEPKDIRWYEAGQALNDRARQDRDNWLVEELV